MRRSGTLAMMTRCCPRKPTSSIWPRRAFRSPSTSPTLASGQVISTFMIGSSRRVPDSRKAWRSASPTAARIAVGGLGQRLAVDDLRPPHRRLDAVLDPHPVDDDVQVQLAHPADDGLAGLRVFVPAEGGILVGHLRQGEVELFFLCLRL